MNKIQESAENSTLFDSKRFIRGVQELLIAPEHRDFASNTAQRDLLVLAIEGLFTECGVSEEDCLASAVGFLGSYVFAREWGSCWTTRGAINLTLKTDYLQTGKNILARYSHGASHGRIY